MPANTPLGLPYPLPTEPVSAGAAAIRSLAEAVDARAGMVKIADQTLAVSAGLVDFLNIPQLYAHLMVVAIARAEFAGTSVGWTARINNDLTQANYRAMRLIGYGAAATAQENFAAGGLDLGNIPGNTAQAGAFAPVTVQIPHYRSTLAQKTSSAECFLYMAGASGQMIRYTIGSIYLAGTIAPITRLTFTANSGLLAAGSRITLYGMP